jgi:hypothetical protein
MQRTPWKTRVTLVTACLIAGAAGAAVMRTDLLLGRSLGTALQQSRSELSFDGIQPAARMGAAVGDEGFWLTRATRDSSSPFAKPILLGDHITISSGGGDKRHFEVTAMKALGPDGTGAAEDNLARRRLMLVVCRLIDASDREPRLVRFIVEMPAAEAAAAVQPKAL